MLGDLVLLHNTKREKDISRVNKLLWKWCGPYRVLEANVDKGNYRLEELDSTPLHGTKLGSRIKKFVVHPSSKDKISLINVGPDPDLE